jgi:hypothetical protein
LIVDLIPGAAEEEQRRAHARAVDRLQLTAEQLWQRYFGLGGDAGFVEIQAYLHALMPLPALQRDILSQAINERLAELPHSVPYSRTIRLPAPGRGPLPALVTLLDRVRRSPPEALPSVAAAAAAALDVGVVIYLVDYQQRWLVPLPAADTGHRERLHVDTTLAGHAFRSTEIRSTEAAGRAGLWVPLRDGDERLGVLEVTLRNPSDLRDPTLRDHLRWLADYLGYLLASQANYGDALHTIRLDRPRTAGAELVWSLLPPLTASTETVSMAGALEPAASLGGDAFDYALSGTTAALAIFDAKGHDLDAGLVVAIALAAYRAARRTGQPLYHQARAIDEAVAAQFDDAFLTGVLAELELTTGRLRYLVAGHPHPLLLRHGKVVKTLNTGGRLPFRLDAYEATVGEETLEPGDWLVLHTDGLTDARDASGALYGQQRLIDFLERAAAGDDPPPETVRRLIHAVLHHQNGVLQDDATVLVTRWDPPAPPRHGSGRHDRAATTGSARRGGRLRVDDDVVAVGPGRVVEGPAAGDEHQAGRPADPEHRCGQGLLRVGAAGGHDVGVPAAELVGDRDPVTGRDRAQRGERAHPGAGRVDVAGQDGAAAAGADRGAGRPPADRGR